MTINNPLTLAVSIIAMLLIFLSGFWLHRSGKPYPTILFTLHKLISLALIIFLIVIATRIQRESTLTSVQLVSVISSLIFFIATIVTGGLLSVEQEMPNLVHLAHKILPFCVLLTTGASFYVCLT